MPCGMQCPLVGSVQWKGAHWSILWPDPIPHFHICFRLQKMCLANDSFEVSEGAVVVAQLGDRSAVRIQSSANVYIEHLFAYCQLYWKYRKSGRERPIFKNIFGTSMLTAATLLLLLFLHEKAKKSLHTSRSESWSLNDVYSVISALSLGLRMRWLAV